MLNFLLPLLKNPLTRIVANKTIGAIQHHLDKEKIINIFIGLILIIANFILNYYLI